MTDTAEPRPSRTTSGSDGCELILHWELSPRAQVVMTVIGELADRHATRLAAELHRLDGAVHTLDLRFASAIDGAGLRVLWQAKQNGLARIVASASVRPALAAAGLNSSVELLGPIGPPQLHRAAYGVAVHDPELRYVYVNDSLAAINGIPAQAHYGHHPAELFDMVDDGLTAVLERVSATGRAERHVVAARIDDQEAAWVCHYGPVDLGDDRGVVAIVGLADDVLTPALRFQARHHRNAGGAIGGGVLSDALQQGLTEREREVLTLLATGLGNQAIAEQLYLSIDTVKTYCQRLYRKLGVTNRTEAANVVHGAMRARRIDVGSSTAGSTAADV